MKMTLDKNSSVEERCSMQLPKKIYCSDIEESVPVLKIHIDSWTTLEDLRDELNKCHSCRLMSEWSLRGYLYREIIDWIDDKLAEHAREKNNGM